MNSKRSPSWTSIAIIIAVLTAIAGCGLAAAATRRSHAKTQAGKTTALARGHWAVLAHSPLGTRYGATFISDGQELLEFGGTAAGPDRGTPQDSGAAYDPARRRWRPIAAVPAVVEPVDAASVWTGNEVFVFGGSPSSHQPGTGCCVAGLYTPATDRWTVSPKAPLDELEAPLAVWSGTSVILAGLHSGTQQQLEVASYTPATNTWTRLTLPISRRHESFGLAMVATNDGVLLWSTWSRTQPASHSFFGTGSGVDVLRLGPSGAWQNVTGSWPQAHTVDGPIFTGSEILVAPGQIWCGLCSHPAPFHEHGYQVDPKTLRIKPLPPGPFDDLDPQIIWTGTTEISFNGGGEMVGPGISVLPGDIAIWNPATHKWSRGPRATLQIDDAPAVWNGNRLYVPARNGALLAYGR
jgi:hypothetical protein